MVLKRKRVLVSGMALAMVVALGAGVAVAGNLEGRVYTRGTVAFEPNTILYSTQRFEPSYQDMHPGDVLTFVYGSNEDVEPHSLTVVDRSELPGSIGRLFQCPICNDVLGRHFGGSRPVFHVEDDDDGEVGLDGRGDSLLIFPGKRVKANITAASGTTLSFLCAFHPWMQGRINVI